MALENWDSLAVDHSKRYPVLTLMKHKLRLRRKRKDVAAQVAGWLFFLRQVLSLRLSLPRLVLPRQQQWHVSEIFFVLEVFCGCHYWITLRIIRLHAVYLNSNMTKWYGTLLNTRLVSIFIQSKIIKNMNRKSNMNYYR